MSDQSASMIAMAAGSAMGVPWLTDEGIDMAKVPLDRTYRTAVGPDRDQALSALRLLESASYYGRREVGVFLMGFLVSLPPADWDMRIAAVKALHNTKTRPCATLLFAELRRVKCSNTTRRYINAVVNVLRRFPFELVVNGFEDLANDKSFSQRMRRRFRDIVEQLLLLPGEP